MGSLTPAKRLFQVVGDGIDIPYSWLPRPKDSLFGPKMHYVWAITFQKLDLALQGTFSNPKHCMKFFHMFEKCIAYKHWE